MCTLTFIPQGDSDFILTSNRDEAPNRNTILPKSYTKDNIMLLYPKDALAGGTWLGVSDQQRLICLLNGGFEPHQRASSYAMSRGIIVTSLLASDNAIQSINDYDFVGIEPFTLVLVEWQKQMQLFQLVWDGSKAHFEEQPLQPQIWSSSLLYSSKIKKQREQWFSNFLSTNEVFNSDALLNFHKTAGDGNPKTNLVMDRGFVKTKSISQIKKNDDLVDFYYEDLQTQHTQITTF